MSQRKAKYFPTILTITIVESREDNFKLSTEDQGIPPTTGDTTGAASGDNAARPINDRTNGRPGGFSSRPPGSRFPRAEGDSAGGEEGQGENSRGGTGAAPRRARRPGGKDRFAPRRRVDQFGVDGIREIDYKDFKRLGRYLSDRGKIEPRRKTGLSAFHQRSLTVAIKRARFMALLPYVSSR